MSDHLISLMISLPVFGVIFQTFFPANRSRWIALAAGLAASAFALVLVFSMQVHTADLQAVESFPWVGSYAISYDMAVDGLNVLLVLLIAILFPILIASEWDQTVAPRGMHGLLLVLQASLFGAVCAQDLFLQFFFWSLSTLPFYFLVGIWGGEQREKAAFRSFVSASLGNALLFVALIIIYYSVDPHSFSLKELSGGRLSGKFLTLFGNSVPVPALAFGLISAGLSLRAPIWPFHGWFTEVAEEAPSSVFVALCAATVPVAMYVFLRVCYLLFPEILNSVAHIICAVGILNLIMGGICAVSQKGLRRLLAFVCLSEVGLVLMGIGSLSSAGVVGAVYQQLVLGLGLAGFGLFSGVIFHRTGHVTFLSDEGEKTFGGIATRAPAVALVAGIVTASLLGFPGFGGFVGHALLIIGSYSTHPLTIVVAAAALLLASYYLFTMYRCVFLGRPVSGGNTFSDLTLREKAYMLPLVAGLLVFGLYPKPLIELIRPTVLTLLSTVK